MQPTSLLHQINYSFALPHHFEFFQAFFFTHSISSQSQIFTILQNISGRGIYILYEDVKSCPYEDVHVLWSILVESHSSWPLKK